jgi:hypothetical protein
MPRWFSWLLIVTVAFEGLRAGAGTFRMILDLPARAQIGPVAFAEFSRATDLSAAGIVFYSVYGVGGFLLTLATFVAAMVVKSPALVRLLTGVAALSSALILVLTTTAAPLMFAIGETPNDPISLTVLIEPFVFWTNIRIALADLSFFAVLLALPSLANRSRVASI